MNSETLVRVVILHRDALAPALALGYQNLPYRYLLPPTLFNFSSVRLSLSLSLTHSATVFILVINEFGNSSPC